MVKVNRVIQLCVLLFVGVWAATLVPVYGTEESPVDLQTASPQAQSDDSLVLRESQAQKGVESSGDQAKDTEEMTLVGQLRSRLSELDERERKIREEEERVAGLRRDLETLAAQQADALAEAEAIKAKHMKKVRIDPTQASLVRLVKVYEAMDSEEAALRIGEMREKLALDILARIKPKKAAGVLAGVEPKKAARLSEGLRVYVTYDQKPTDQ